MKLYHLQSGPLNVNTYFLVNEDGQAVVIDSGENYKKVKSVEELYNIKIQAVLLTHAHFDHCGNAKKLQDDGASIYVSELDAPKLLNDDNLAKDFGRKFDYCKADYTFYDGEILDIEGIKIIEDCYNASPESMKAAFAVQKSIASEKEGSRMVALLGDMYELGEESGRFHEQVGSDYANAGGELLFTFGQSAEGIATGAILHGMLTENVYRNADIKNPALSGEMLLHSLRGGDVLLVKASRGAAA